MTSTITIASDTTRKTINELFEGYEGECEPVQQAEYLAKLDESIAQAEQSEVVKYTMEELKSLVDGE